MADDRGVEIPDADQYEQTFQHEHVDGALIIEFGHVIPGREALAVQMFTEVSRYLGRLLADDVISSFKPYFYADGAVGNVTGFFLLEGHRGDIDALRRTEDFAKLLLKTGAAVQGVRSHALVAGSEAGRLVNIYREIRTELGLMSPPPGRPQA